MTRLAPLALVLLVAPLVLVPSPAEGRDKAPASPGPLAEANNKFAWDLYGALREGDGNLFFSPYSVSTALLMTREGARGETAAQMDKVLHLKDVRRAAGHRALTTALRPPEGPAGHGHGLWAGRLTKPHYEMHVANRLWGQEGYTFEAPFLALLSKSYGAPLERIDFKDRDGARKRINAWVEKQTREKIKDIVPKGMPPPLTRLVLANAIYFKAKWMDPFETRWTKEDTFTGPKGKKIKAPFMWRIGSYAYGEVNGVQVVELPYITRTTSMVIFLPRKKDGIGSLEEKLCGGKMRGWESALKTRRVDVKVPRFKYTVSKDLTATLPRMGMPLAFDGDKADFSGMTKAEKLFIGAVLHKAFVAVDEKGTEAAAATVVMMKAGGPAPSHPPVMFTADHPFVYVIRHRPTKTILFAGRVMEPTQG